ncbi:MAG TPA: alginate export family protein, partial [Candidatus Paceibacterota bacterium]|nr:alginate export family protein [Candidatus Paceibacterota bacterium]
MKNTKSTLTAGALVLAALNQVYGQYAPPPPPAPFPGFINEALRKDNPYMNQWDIGGALRMRYEVKENALGLPPANDFRKVTTSTGQNDNSYFSDKVLARIGYTDKWWSAFIEGRSSSTTGDARSRTGAGTVPGPGAGPESDGVVDLHQAYFTVGNHKEFPLSLKVGRQELSYGDERLVGAFAWNNIGRVFDAVKVRAQTPWFALEAFTSKLVLPDDNNFNMWNDYNLFSGLYLTTKLIPKNTAELYFFSRNDGIGSATADSGAVLPFQTAAPAARDIYTVGTRFKSNPNELGNFDYTVEGAYQ